MITRRLGITFTLLSCAAFLLLTGGCSSSHKEKRMTQPRHSRTAPSRRDMHHDHRRDRSQNDDRDYRRQRSAADLQVDSNRESPATVSQTAQATESRTEPRAALRDHETLVSAVEPPLTLVETPSRTPNGDEFWVGGHWFVDASGFSWQSGRIERSRPGEMFATGHWAPTKRGWEYTEEYWR